MRVAFCGLGRMGSGMASRLVAAGHDVTVWNRTPSACEPLRALGARVAATPREASEGAEAIVAMVADDDASRAVWLGPDGVLAGHPAANAFAIECSTLSHAWASELVRLTTAAGLRHLDAPVTGLPDAAAAGHLTLLIGADPDDLDAARPLLDALATNLVRFGPPGAGTAYKLIVNLLGAVQIGSAAEALTLAERAGLDLGQVVDVLATSQAASPQVVRTTGRMLADDADAEVTFSGRLRRKDAAYALDLARALGASTPFADAALTGLDELLAAGRGDANETAIIEIARQRIPAPTASESGRPATAVEERVQPVRQRPDRQRGRPRFVYNTATTLNGFLATSDDSLDWLFAIPGESPDLEPFMDAVTVLVVGRTTYDWVVRAENLLDEPAKWQAFFGRRPMFVFSSRDLDVPAGADVRRVSGPVADALPTIWDAAGDGVVWVQGGGDLAGQFLDADSLDQVVLALAPVTLSRGRPVLPRDVFWSRLRLREASKVGEFASLVYDVVAAPQTR